MKYRIFLIILICISSAFLLGQSFQLDNNPNIQLSTTSDGQKLIGFSIPGNPPPKNFRMPKAQLQRGSYLIQDVPAYDWSFGCGPTSAAMMAAYYDRNGYPNIYTGPSNNGIAPLNNSIWGSININGETRKQCPLSATRMGLDGRSTRGHVDDYWVQENSTATDPFIVNGWTEHEHSDCTADYMKTSQYNYNNNDGNSSYWVYSGGLPYTGDNTTNDMLYGLQQYFLSRGYQVNNFYNQQIQGFNGNNLGFTFEQFQIEIMSGRPVLVNLKKVTIIGGDTIKEGHTILGVGFNKSTNKIYLHDTWDYDLHEMDWGGSYYDLPMNAVSVIQLQPYYQSDISLLNQIEYFYDQDPGFGNGNALQTDFSLSASLEFQLPMNELEDGIHLLQVRAKNAAGIWSVSAYTPFYKFTLRQPEIDAVEYFINTDPGIGNGTPVTSQNKGIKENFSFNLPLSNLSDGIHNLFIRTLQTTGEWSITQKSTFFKYTKIEPEVVQLEYFIDNDPGEGSGIPIPIQPNVSIEILTEIETAELNKGIHVLYVRSKDNYNKWSLNSSHPFYVFPERNPLNISDLEYYIDADPGNGNGHHVNLDSIVKTVHQSFLIDPACNEEGDHIIYFRGKDNKGAWSLSQMKNLNLELLPIEIAVNGTTTFCEGVSVSLSVNNLPDCSYQWTRNGTLIQGAISSAFVAYESGDYKIIINHNTDCQDTSLAVSVTVIPLPTDASAIIGSESACENSSNIFFSVNEIPYVTAYTWSYSGTGATLFPNGNEVTVNFALGATDGELSVFGTNSCGTGGVSIKNISINKRSVIAESILAEPNSIVKGESTILSYEGGFAGTGAEAKWYNDGCMGNLVANGNNVEMLPAETTTYYMQFAGACNATPCLNLSVTVLPVALQVFPESYQVGAASGTVTFQINCNSSWSITNDNNWLSISQSSGNKDAEITVQFDTNTTENLRIANLEFASQDESITQIVYIQQSGIVNCTPNWLPLPNLQFNMQIVAKIMIDGQVSLNPNDVIGAFVGDECRGIASPTPELDGMVFLTVGSNEASGEHVELKIWNSNDCSVCNAIPGFAFVNQGEIGTFLEPYQLRCGAIQELTFGQGYTWFSVNVNPGTMLPANLFSVLAPCYDDRVIGQTSFALYTGTSWVGSLTTLGMDKMYRMKLCSAQNLSLMGEAATLNPISLNAGYTWLGYQPQQCQSVSAAMAGLSPGPSYNDRVIGQSSFALYTGTAWIGSLTQLCPGKGYIVKLAIAQSLTYPAGTSKGSPVVEAETISPTGVYPVENMQHTMMVMAQLRLPDGSISLNEKDVVYAMIDGVVMGMATPDAGTEGMIFLSVGSDTETAQPITFMVWLDERQKLLPLNETLSFEPLAAIGELNDPFILTLGEMVGVDEMSDGIWIGEPYPNPMSVETFLPVRSSQKFTMQMQIYNGMGQVITELPKESYDQGHHQIQITRNGLLPGVYIVKTTMVASGQNWFKNIRLIVK